MTYVVANGTAAYNRAKYKPHDKTIIRIARNTHNAAANNVATGSIINMITIPAECVLLGVATEIVVDSDVAGDQFDVGFVGGVEFGADLESNQVAGVVAIPENLVNPWFVKAANVVTLTSNGETMDAGTIQLTATWVELDSFGAAG